MTSTDTTAPYEALQIGDCGPHVELYLGPLCVYSGRVFRKLEELAGAFDGALRVQIRLHPQPWHLFSGVVTRCIWAAVRVGGDEAGLAVMRAAYGNLSSFTAEGHRSGPRLDDSPSKLISALEELTQLELRDAFETPEVTDRLIWSVKYARQNGVHGSPAFAINGVLEPRANSGQDVDRWAELIVERS